METVEERFARSRFQSQISLSSSEDEAKRKLRIGLFLSCRNLSVSFSPPARFDRHLSLIQRQIFRRAEARDRLIPEMESATIFLEFSNERDSS